MNKYKKLAFNTVIFAVGSFSSKIFALLLNNLYTRHISPSDFYAKSLIETVALFLLPVFTFSLTEAVVRYGLDNKYDKKEIFSTSSVLTAAGLAAMFIAVPSLRLIPFLKPVRKFIFLLGIYVCTSALRALCSQFVRARGMVKLFAADGILTTITLFLFSLVFVSFFELGVRGFMISTILSDLCSAVFLTVSAKLHSFFSIHCFSKPLAKNMMRFSLPLIPTTVMWTFTGFSDQIFVGNLRSDHCELGESAAGIYSAAAKIPNLLSMVSTIFFQAWNMSAITENDSSDRNKFYEKVYGAYEAVLFIGGAFLIFLVKPISAVLINYSAYPEYSKAYMYTPLLIAASVYTCLNLFLSSIYTATQHTKNAFLTILAVFTVNIILDFCIIPEWGIQGAAFATFLSYLFCYCIRMIDARYYVPFRFSKAKHLLNSALLLLMCIFRIFLPSHCTFLLLLLTAAICLLNFNALAETAKKLLKK